MHRPRIRPNPVMAVIAALLGCSSATDETAATGSSGGGAAGAGDGGGGAAGGTSVGGAPLGVGGSGGDPATCSPFRSSAPTQAGDGRCGRPGESPIPGCTNACSGGPGVESCAPSVLDEYGTACCAAGRCEHDFGGGCGVGDPVTSVTLATVAACDPAGAELGVVFETSGSIGRVRAAPAWLAFTVSDASGTALHRVDKATCRDTVLASGHIDSFAIYDDGSILAQRRDADTFEQSVEIHSVGGNVTPFDLGTLVGADSPNLTVLETAGDVAYVLAEFETPGDPSSWTRRLVEVPCCGDPARVVAPDVASDTSLPEMFSATAVGSTLYLRATDMVLDVGPVSAVLAVDLATGTQSLLFEEARGAPPQTITGGRATFGLEHSIAAVDLDTCATETLVDRPMAEITAVTSDGDTMYWAERYYGLVDYQRIYRRSPGGNAILIAHAAVGVGWVGVDASHVYWLEGQWADAQRLARAAPP